jgi:hypothetical protein
MVKTVPDVILLFCATKLGFIVYAEVVYALYVYGEPVEPLKNPLGAALL